MKILLAGNILGQGGIQTHLRWLARALGEEGFEVLVISIANQLPSPLDLQDIQHFQSEQVNFIFCHTQEIKKDLVSNIQYLAKITTHVREFFPDIYLAVGTGWNLFLPPLFSGSQTKRIFHEVMSGFVRSWRHSRWIVRWCFHEVIGQSPIVAENFAQSFGWEKQITAIPAIPEPLELTACLPQPISRTVELGKAKAALFSRLVPHKQAFWLVQQWEYLKDVLDELHIHGSGPEEELIREYIASQGIGDRVKCFGRYPNGQAYVDLISTYDLTLLPTVGSEGAPLVLLESMACGVPFVAYGVGGIPDYGVNNLNVLIVAPERWRTDQARVYADVENKDKSFEQGNQSSGKTSVFVSAIKQMVYKLAQREIDQAQLQQFYLERYSYSVLKKVWISYLCKQ
ncbi:MAG: glycosyltransferase family 4 protein [Nostoc sp.]|uniref:glycosyltransferase family 4 protein n=1 Tax=Nostoc sp. TaxID=1180 RepID=UPI002FEE79FF